MSILEKVISNIDQSFESKPRGLIIIISKMKVEAIISDSISDTDYLSLLDELRNYYTTGYAVQEVQNTNDGILLTISIIQEHRGS